MIREISSNSLQFNNILLSGRFLKGSQTTLEARNDNWGQAGIPKTDLVELSSPQESLEIYSGFIKVANNLPDTTELLRGIIKDVFSEQGTATTVETENGQIDLEEINQKEALKLVADDGYFGVEKTSERIVSFATGIAGGDTSRLDAIRKGVEKGFQEAMDAFGGWLPEISHATLDAVMIKLDKWASS